jgi:pilus assembly protein Flp/PilA
MTAMLNRFWKDESGQGLTEYVLIIALIAVALIACLIVFRNQIGGVFNRASKALNNAPGTGFPVSSL